MSNTGSNREALVVESNRLELGRSNLVEVLDAVVAALVTSNRLERDDSNRAELGSKRGEENDDGPAPGEDVRSDSRD